MNISPLNKVIPSWGAPTLEGFDLNSMQDGQRIKGSARQFVRFYFKKFLQIYATDVKINEKTGSTTVLKTGTREVEREMVEIITPGDKNIVDDFAADFHKREHWRQYKAFRDGESGPVGTPIDECEFVSPHIATELRYYGCHTLEQLADAGDVFVTNVPNGWELREYARQVVKVNEKNKDLSQVKVLQAQLEKSSEIIQAMEERLKALESPLVDASGDPISLPTLDAQPIKKSKGRQRKADILLRENTSN